MENKVNLALVGGFVLVLATALVGVVLWLASGGAYQTQFDRYDASVEESVSGLNPKAPVKYNGVDVGQVERIWLDPENPQRVKLRFQIEQGTPVKVDTVATLKTQGLTGIAYVELSGGTPGSPALTRHDGQQHPVIQTRPSLSTRFENVLTQVLARAKRQKGKAALFFLDMDDFKKVNDRYGHLAGDTLLKEAGSRIVACVREMDTVCRLGGDEFTVILPAVAGPGEAESIAGRIMEAFREPFVLGGENIVLSLSVGIGIYPDHGESVEQLLSNADEAMYRAKGQGKRICFLSPRNTSAP